LNNLLPSGTAIVGAILALTLFLTLFSGPLNISILRVYCAGADPDAYGNYIDRIEIWQWNETAGDWDTIADIDWTSYNNASGFDVQINSDTKIKFIARPVITNSCASSDAEAKAYTRVLLTVTDKYDEESMVWNATQPGTGYWRVSYSVTWDEAGKPEGGKQYQVTFDYEVYR